MYGVNSKKLIFARIGITPNNPTGSRWQLVLSPLAKHVSAGNSAIWMTDTQDNINLFTGKLLLALS